MRSVQFFGDQEGMGLKIFSYNHKLILLVVMGLFALGLFAGCTTSESENENESAPTVVPTKSGPPTVIPETPSPAATAVPPTVAPTSAPAPTATAVTPMATPEPAGPDFDTSRFEGIEGIIDPTNFDWPRSIETSEGIVTLDAPPQRIHSLSLGHTEILAALMDFVRLTAVYSFFSDPEQSNISDLAAAHNQIGFDPEEVVALDPEIAIASSFTNAATVELLKDSGIPVARASLENSVLGNVPNILLIGYMIGAEKEAIALADMMEARMSFIEDLLVDKDSPRVLSISKYTSIFAAGSGSTEGGIIEQAGAVNAAADSGIEGHAQVTIEGIAAINPDVIVVPQPLAGAEVFIDELMSSPVLAEVPAVKNGQVHYVVPRYHTTLSHWNVRGVERIAELLFPSAFSGVELENFSHYPN